MFTKFFSALYPYSPYQFAVWRISFGIFLTYYLWALWPYAAELFSREGVVADPAANPLYGYFPNTLYIFDSPQFVSFFVLGLSGLALAISLGVWRRSAALLLWYGWACLFGRNVLTEDPSLAMVGWLILALAIIPLGEPWTLRAWLRLKRRLPTERWYLPATVYWGALFMLGFGFTFSGLDRFLTSPSWFDGTAMSHLPYLLIGLDWWLVDLLRVQPPWLAKLETWLALGTFICSLPLLLLSTTRPYLLAAIAAMFVFVWLVFDLTQVVYGVLLTVLFVYDAGWLFQKLGYTHEHSETHN